MQSLSDASHQMFAFMTRELGRLMATLTIVQPQVWQSETSRGTLCLLPVTPGWLFGPEAQMTLERRVQVTKAEQHFADLSRLLCSAQQPALRPGPSRHVPIGPLIRLPFVHPGYKAQTWATN